MTIFVYFFFSQRVVARELSCSQTSESSLKDIQIPAEIVYTGNESFPRVALDTKSFNARANTNTKETIQVLRKSDKAPTQGT